MFLSGDDLYESCIRYAKESRCQKMGWGSIIVMPGDTKVIATNQPILGLESLCEPTCIRLNIQSRTDALLGACEHAETNAIWYALNNNLVVRGCNVYVAGIAKDGAPILNHGKNYTCLRCAITMSHAGIKSVLFPVAVDEGWFEVSISQALLQAKDYALGLKRV